MHFQSTLFRILVYMRSTTGSKRNDSAHAGASEKRSTMTNSTQSFYFNDVAQVHSGFYTVGFILIF